MKMIQFAGVDYYTGCCHLWKLVSLFILMFKVKCLEVQLYFENKFFFFKHNKNAGKEQHGEMRLQQRVQLEALFRSQ